MHIPTLVNTKKPNASVLSEAIENGFTPMQSLLLANRAQRDDWKSLMTPDYKWLPNHNKYQDMRIAATRIANAIEKKEKIVACVDFDSDGINSGAIFFRAMTEHFGCSKENVFVQISHRSLWGYGLSEYAVKNVFREHSERLPDIILTADQGSSDEENIKTALQMAEERNHRLDVIVTDHHHIPDNWPESAHSFVNPQRQDNLNQDEKDVCGATMAFLLMLAVKDELQERGALGSNTKLFSLLSHCAIATISDVMSIESPVNRFICQAGFRVINTSPHPAWSVLRSQSNELIEEEFVGFQIAPRINASSRVGLSGNIALDFLTTSDVEIAIKNFKAMTEVNEERKEIGITMMQDAIDEAERQVESGNVVIVIYLEQGSSGNSGIVAGKIKEHFNRPAIMLAPNNKIDATGSARSIPGIDIRSVLEKVSKEKPGLLTKFGGHPVAAGMNLPIENIPELTRRLNEEVKKIVNEDELTPILEVDFHLNDLKNPLSIHDIEGMNALKPFGQKFPKPLFSIKGEVFNLKPLGKLAKIHLSFMLQTEQGSVRCIWFNARASEDAPFPIENGSNHLFCAEASINRFKNDITPQLMIAAQGKKQN